MKAGKDEAEGWHNSAYFVSKVADSALSIAQQKVFDKETPNRNISLNHVHPGYVDTDLVEHGGPLTIEEGARSTLYVIFDADFKGMFQ